MLDAKVVAVQKLLRRLIRMEEYEDQLSKIQTDVTGTVFAAAMSCHDCCTLSRATPQMMMITS